MTAPPHDAWEPDADALVALLRSFDSHSHYHLGHWSFWDTGSPHHLTICHWTGKAYWTDVTTDSKAWVSRTEAAQRGWLHAA